MADGLALDSCEVRPGVLAAWFDPNYSTLRAPFKHHTIPGIINAADYDLGNHGTTYSDSDIMATTGTPGGGNNGTKYRNDGVDIEPSTDAQGFKYNVGWMEPLEWLLYTVDIETAGQYDIQVRVASADGGGRFRLLLNNERLGGDVTVPHTGGWQNWTSVWLRDVTLPAGQHDLKLLVRTKGQFNINRMTFNLLSATDVEEAPEVPQGVLLDGFYPNPFAEEVRLAFTTARPADAHVEVFDLLGRRVHTQAWPTLSAGKHTLTLAPDLAAGTYLFRLVLGQGHQSWSYTRPLAILP